ncbi:Winged helix-turn-helix DNA-binding [Pseudobutyrivibrio ruminis]|uniref:Winged helix-turn-helix DNA-binding n=1 Tax=Pseudobutyrivibrio ruminis TaxID=46206 RepID=A0A1H7GV32_9FIRM|nr:winged helix-turn-helix domain-containing protein [Pseudobutyrivibrio ruminis]SEK40490.1 Winged helix-turn-helix DNA-binding [Pseudobutyrivibrio ruminis]
MKEIILDTPEKNKIYMNPQRQRLIRLMQISGEAMTPKQLSKELGISPSAATAHIKKLESLGVLRLDYTKKINGITAKYYALEDVNISLKTNEQQDDSVVNEQEVFLNYMMNENWQGFLEYKKGIWAGENKSRVGAENLSAVHQTEISEDVMSTVHSASVTGDVISSVAFLTDEDAAELKNYIIDFLASHADKQPNTKPWSTTLLAYPVDKR